jgi:hypothetical protein
MTEADDNVVELRDLDQLFEDVLAGQALGPDAPAWSADLARLVHGARVEAAPGELAGHDAIVASMLEIRRAATVAGDAGVRDADARPPLQLAEGASPPAVAASGPVGSVGGTPLPRHVRGERGYRAKHAAARTQASSIPTARHVGRLIGVKAAAVTTAVVVGTVAAAAATSEIVTNVVVPAFVTKVPDSSPTTKTTTSQRSDRGDGGGGAGGGEDLDETVAVPACQFTPVCSPLTPAGPAAENSVPTTERPGTTTTTTEPPATTTTTPATTTTTEPEPTTTTTTESPPPTEPSPLSVMLSPDPAASSSQP